MIDSFGDVLYFLLVFMCGGVTSSYLHMLRARRTREGLEP